MSQPLWWPSGDEDLRNKGPRKLASRAARNYHYLILEGHIVTRRQPMFCTMKVRKNQNSKRPGRFRARLRLEELESRTLLSVFTPAQIRHAYAFDQITFNQGIVKGDGTGQTVALIDAYYDKTIQSDLASFSSRFGLAQLDGKNGDGHFTQLDLSNKTPSPVGDDWTVETALDVEWAHAIAPKANILLAEAASDTSDGTGKPADLLNAVQAAATTPGVVAVSMSWGISEVPQETNWDSYFTTPGVTFLAASGDSGAGTIWPSVSPNVVSVGGTTLHLTSTNTISSETGWGHGNLSWYYGGSGGGFSQYEPLPSYQSGITTSSNGFKYTQFGVRLNPDVAYVADPNTGLYVLDAGRWYAVGGTSAGAPQWAALVAIADQGRSLAHLPSLGSIQTLNALYANPGDFHDITKGSTGTYYVYDSNGNVVGTIPVTAGPGYDLVTGLGTPIANKIVPALANVASASALTKLAASSTIAQSLASTASNTIQSTGRKLTTSLALLSPDGLANLLLPVAQASIPLIPVSPLARSVAPAVFNTATPVSWTPSHAVISAAVGGSSAYTAVDENLPQDNPPATDTPTESKPNPAPVPAAPPAVPLPEERDMDATPQMDFWQDTKDGSFIVEPGEDDGMNPAAALPVRNIESLATGDPLGLAAGLALVLNGYWTPSSARIKEEERQ
jgi:hypothetical protein